MKIMAKECRQCKQIKEESEFYPKRRICKKCKSSNDSARKRKQYTNDTALRQRKKEYDKAYVQNNREKYNAYQTAYYMNKYYTNEDFRVTMLLRAYKRRTLGTLTVQQWHDICELFDNSCAYCGSKHNLTMDHVVPVARGGLTEYYNIVPACKSCNSSKNVKDVIEWYTAQPFYDRARLENILKFTRMRQMNKG